MRTSLFVLSALFATTSAIQLSVEKESQAEHDIDDVFTALDKNHDGKIEWGEVKSFVHSHCGKGKSFPCPSKAQFQQAHSMFDAADENHDGAISKKEFEDAVRGSGSGLAEEDDEEAEGLAQLMKNDHEADEKKMVDYVFAHADKNGDHQLSWEEIGDFVEANCKKWGHCPDEEEQKEFQLQFEKADTNHNGKLSKKELLHAIENHGLAQLEEAKGDSRRAQEKKMVDYIFKQADKNGDHQLSWNEIGNFVEKNCKKWGHCPNEEEQKEFQLQFEKADTNHNGKISKKELLAAIDSHGLAQIAKGKGSGSGSGSGGKSREAQEEKMVNYIFKQADENGDGQLSWEEIGDYVEKNCKKWGHCPSEAEEKEFQLQFNEADTNGNGKISKKELLAVIHSGHGGLAQLLAQE